MMIEWWGQLSTVLKMMCSGKHAAMHIQSAFPECEMVLIKDSCKQVIIGAALGRAACNDGI